MPESTSQYVADIDLETETDEKKIAQKVTSEIQGSRAYWSDFKDLCTELYFDFLAYKESITDDTKSNTFIPLSYVDVQVVKAQIKNVLTSTWPYARVKPHPYDPTLSHRLSILAATLLDEAGFKEFLDILVQDALIYPGAIFQVDYGVEYKNLPAFDVVEIPEMQPLRFPKFGEATMNEFGEIIPGERIFEPQEVREGLFLENINIQDFYLPKNARDAEKDAWAAKVYSKTLTELRAARNPDGSPKYTNLDELEKLGTTKRADQAEKSRGMLPAKRDYPSQPTYGPTFDIIEFVTNGRIFHVPEGADFLINNPTEKNPMRQKPFHIARVEKLTGEPFGFSPNRANHLMTRTYNEIWDIVMDGLYLEDNKAWIINEELVDDFEVGAAQGNLIHVKGMDPGIDVASAVKAIETRALATEVFPLIEKIDTIHQLVGARPNQAAGVPVLGAETAYENAMLEAGTQLRPLDMASNIVGTALKPIYEDLFHFLKIHYAKDKEIEVLGDNGEIIDHMVITPEEVYSDVSFHFEFLGKEKKRMQEQAATINLLQVWGNMVNIDPVSVLLMKNLLINSGLTDTPAIEQALEQSIQQRQMIQMMELELQAQQVKNQGQAKKAGDKQGPVHQSSSKTANRTNPSKPVGA